MINETHDWKASCEEIGFHRAEKYTAHTPMVISLRKRLENSVPELKTNFK